MSRKGIGLTTTLAAVFQAVVLQAVVLQAMAAAQLIDPEPAGELWQVSSVVQENAVVYGEDGSVYAGGSADGEEGCPSGATAFLRKTGPDGTVGWQLGGGSATPGVCWGHFGGSLVGQLTSVDPVFVVFSSLHGIALDPATGMLGVTGELLLAWEDGASARQTTGRGAFAALVTPDGQVVRDAYLGTVPDGPPLAEVTCAALCALGEETRGAQFGGRGAAFAPGRKLAVTGFHVPASAGPEPVGDTGFFTALFDRELNAPEWIHTGGTPGHDCGMGVAANADGELLVVGYGGLDRDILLARYAMDGSLERLRFASGPMDDVGLAAEPLADRHWRVAARITDQCTVDGQTLGAPGQGQLDAVLELDSELQLVDSALIDPFASAKAGPYGPRKHFRQADSKSSDGMDEYPDVTGVVEGGLGTGGVDELNLGDGYLLRAYQEESGRILLSTHFELPSEPMVLKAVAVEVHTSYCYTATFRMRNLDTGDLVTLSEKDVCPGGPAALVYEVPEEQSRDLGFDGSEILPLDMRIDFEIRFRGAGAALSAKSAGSTKDASLDQFTAKVDYAE